MQILLWKVGRGVDVFKQLCWLFDRDPQPVHTRIQPQHETWNTSLSLPSGCLPSHRKTSVSLKREAANQASEQDNIDRDRKRQQHNSLLVGQSVIGFILSLLGMKPVNNIHILLDSVPQHPLVNLFLYHRFLSYLPMYKALNTPEEETFSCCICSLSWVGGALIHYHML